MSILDHFHFINSGTRTSKELAANTRKALAAMPVIVVNDLPDIIKVYDSYALGKDIVNDRMMFFAIAEGPTAFVHVQRKVTSGRRYTKYIHIHGFSKNGILKWYMKETGKGIVLENTLPQPGWFGDLDD